MLAWGEIWWAPAGENGLVTLLTWASGRSEATTWLIRRLVGGDRGRRVEDDVGGVAGLGGEALR